MKAVVVSAELIQQLASGQSCRVEDCYLSPDPELGLIWGTDGYGIDFVACSKFSIGDEESARAALERAVVVAAGDNEHDHYYQPELLAEAAETTAIFQ